VKITHVAAAVLLRPDGSYLLGQRAVGTFYPGYWEFPGGKVEAGESPREAVIRELHEELGIEVVQAYPWIVREHRYEHANVKLHFFRVTEWRGELQDHVHAALAWQPAGVLTASPMLPANGPVLKALALPDFYAITDAGEIGIDRQLGLLEQSLRNRLRLVQIREPELAEPQLTSFAAQAVRLCQSFGARVLINGDMELATELGADGIHLPARQLMTLAQRPDFKLVGASCHNATELLQAEQMQLDFAVVGPVAVTASHPGQAAIGWSKFSDVVQNRSLPVFAIGGMTPDNMTEAWRQGAHGIAAIRSAWTET